MSCSCKCFFVLLLTLLTPHLINATEKYISTEKVDPSVVNAGTELRVKEAPRPDGVTIINPAGSPAYRIDGFVVGQELYKNYIDPSLTCPDPYPFTVTEVGISMYFSRPIMIFASVDIEDVIYGPEHCPFPDSPLAISTDYQVYIKEAGYYDIWVPLDEPVTVYGPFFAGLFIGNPLDTTSGVSLLTDSDGGATCRCYNIWDERIGFVDPVGNESVSFPGRLLIYAAGCPASAKPPQPGPEISVLSPRPGEIILGKTTIWAFESSGSDAIDYMSFEYSSGGPFREFGRDYTALMKAGDSPPCPGGRGSRCFWDCSGLKEGTYTIRVTVCDSLGRSVSDEVSVYVEPTPPVPELVSPNNFEDVCSEVDFLMSCRDEDVSEITLYCCALQSTYSAGLTPLCQSDYGEFGERYGGPVAAACAIRRWAGRGHDYLNRFSDSVLVELLAEKCRSRVNRGTSVESLYRGLGEFIGEHAGELTLEHRFDPDYRTIRCLAQAEGKSVLLAIGPSPPTWLTVDGVSRKEGVITISVMNPLTGTIERLPWRADDTKAEICFEKQWRPVEMLLAVGAESRSTDGHVLGSDRNPADGWQLSWTAPEESSPSEYFIKAVATDDSGISGASTIWVRHDCSGFYEAGDYNRDGSADIVDLTYLIAFVTGNGPPPTGGSQRADANGDNHVNLTDVVYYMNYLYGSSSPPRH
ncbi:MAG: hypothetical protein JSW34_09825 [Candidatus Zixiibacteriota bacterium]|nr:MAG: hypothetical protein JSW34_09825 [candidate division Zixibacteria bacterium]